MRPPGEKHWNVVSIKASFPDVKGRSEPPALSNSVVLLPVASARSSLLVELPSSSSLPVDLVGALFKFGNCKKRWPVPNNSKPCRQRWRYSTADDTMRERQPFQSL